jgi:aspartate/methionine/tyrosine aminotransferase
MPALLAALRWHARSPAPTKAACDAVRNLTRQCEEARESFGAGGTGHLRVALTVDEEQIAEASRRIARLAERV